MDRKTQHLAERASAAKVGLNRHRQAAAHRAEKASKESRKEAGLSAMERAALSHGEALHLSAGVDRHNAGPEPRQNSRFAPQPRPLQGSGGQPASTKGGGPSLRPNHSSSSTGRSASTGRTPKPTSDAQRLGAQMPPSQPQFKLAQIRGIGGGAKGGSGVAGPNVAPPLAQQRSADELEERRRKREEARANNRQKNMVGQGGGSNSSHGNVGAVKSPLSAHNGATSDGEGAGSNSRDGSMPRRKSRFDSGSRASSSSQDSMQRAAALVAQSRSGTQLQSTDQQEQQQLNQGRSATHPSLTYSRSAYPGHHPGGAIQREERKDEDASSEEDEDTVAERVGTSAVVFWAAPKPRPPALGPRRGYRLGQRPEYRGGYGGGPYGGAGGYYGQPSSRHLQGSGGGSSSGGRGSAAKPPPAKLHVTVKSAVNLLNVQLLGTQDPMVRVWTNYTKKGHQCETKPHMNGGKRGVWNESFTLPALKHQKRMVLVFEVRNYNGDVLPSDLIGVGTFPVPEVRDCPNDEIIELYAKKSHGFFSGSSLMRGLYGNAHDASASEFVESAGKLRVNLQLEPLALSEQIGLNLRETTEDDFAAGTTAAQRQERQRLYQMKEQRFREQQDLADSLALKDVLQDNKSETSSLALAGDDDDEGGDDDEGNNKDEEAAAIARAAEDGSKSPASREDVQAEADGHNKATAQQREVTAVEEAGAEDTRRPSELTTAAATDTTIGSSDHQQHQQPPPPPHQPTQRAAAVHLMLGHRRSDGYTFAASLDSELAPHPSTARGAPSSPSSSAAALALAPAVDLPSSEVPEWHGVAQVTLIRADGLPSYAELYLQEDQSAPSIGRPTLGRWLSLLGLGQYAPVIEKNFGFLRSDDVSLELFVNATNDPALLSQIIHACNLSNRETTVLMLWLSRYRELGWPHALASGLEKHPGYLDEGTATRQKVARKLHGLADHTASRGGNNEDDSGDGDVPCVAMLPASYTLALVPNWRQVVAQQQKQQATGNGNSATGASAGVATGSLAACFGTCIFPCPDPVEVLVREPLRGNYVALFVPPNSAPGDVLEITVNIRFETPTSVDHPSGTAGVVGGGANATTNALERSFEQLSEGAPKKTVMGRIFGSTFMQPWSESEKKPEESDRAARSSKGFVSDVFRRLSRNSHHLTLKSNAQSEGAGNSKDPKDSHHHDDDGHFGDASQDAKEEPNSGSQQKGDTSPVRRDAPPEAIAAAAMRGAKASQGIGPSSGALLPYGGSKDDDVRDPAESFAAARRAVEDQNRAAEVAVWRKVSAFLHDIQVTEGLSLRALFNELDINHDNVVTPEEFVKRMRTQKIFKLPVDEVKILMKELDPDDSGLIFYGVFSRTLRAQRAVIKLLDKAAREAREAEERGEVVPSDAPMLKAGLLSGAWEASSRREARAESRADGKADGKGKSKTSKGESSSKGKDSSQRSRRSVNRKGRQEDSDDDDDESADTSGASSTSSSSGSDSEEHFFRRARREKKKKKKKAKKKDKKKKDKKNQQEKDERHKQQLQQQQMAADMAVARMAGSIYAPMPHVPPHPYHPQQEHPYQQHPQPPYHPQHPYHQGPYQNHPPHPQDHHYDDFHDEGRDDQGWSGPAAHPHDTSAHGSAGASPPAQAHPSNEEPQFVKPQPSADFSAEKFFLDPKIPRGLKKLWRQVEAYIDKRHGLDGAKLVQMFREFDANGNGVLSADELRGQLARVGLRFNDEDFELFLAEVDTNGDGMIEYAEFQDAVLGHHRVKMPSTGQRAARALT